MSVNNAEPRRSRLLVVSNRLPVVVKRDAGGQWQVSRGSGGLVTALLPVLRGRGGTWVGWLGTSDPIQPFDDVVQQASAESGCRLSPVALSEEERKRFYHGFANEILWPLFHDLQSHCVFDPSYWQAYQTVNRRYAEVACAQTEDSDFVWVHDYHLMTVGAELRRLGARARLGFFLHIPFPPLDIYVKLPWRLTLLRALLDYDLVGFQCLRDRRNFVDCVRNLLRDVRVFGRGQVITARVGERDVRIGSFPIGIDFNAFMRGAASREVGERVNALRALLPGRKLILGVDRLDYTKGIPQRLEAFRSALARFPDLHERVTLVQVVVPSREEIPQYEELRTRIEQRVGEINGQFTRPGDWVPIHYIFRHLDPVDLLAYYRLAEIALVTPLKDGMNLVAKEYCACSVEENCVLVLSEFAGASAQLQDGALLVNPYDTEGMAEALHRAFTMDHGERRARMRQLRRAVRAQDVFWWVNSFLRAAIARDLSNFPLPPDYVPQGEATTAV